jgi:hypothetical protein
MLFLAHQQGHKVSVSAAPAVAPHQFGGTFMLMGTGISILLAVLVWI